MVSKGDSIRVTICLNANDLRYWDEIGNSWRLESGKVRFFIGSSSADKKLEGEITLSK